MAIDRVWDSDADSAAPIVPEERANAAMSCVREISHQNRLCSHEEFLPRLGPDTYGRRVHGMVADGGEAHTTRSICPGKRLCKPTLAQVAGVYGSLSVRAIIDGKLFRTPSRRIHSA